jgi:hypothetical protein
MLGPRKRFRAVPFFSGGKMSDPVLSVSLRNGEMLSKTESEIIKTSIDSHFFIFVIRNGRIVINFYKKDDENAKE